jgi:transposase-like protein
MIYLWRAVDAEGEVLEVLVQSKRNKDAAETDAKASEEIRLRSRTIGHG